MTKRQNRDQVASQGVHPSGGSARHSNGSSLGRRRLAPDVRRIWNEHVKRRKAVLVLAVASIAVAATWLLIVPAVPSVDALAATNLSAAADELMLHVPEGTVPKNRWPADMRQFRPESIRVAPEGVYLRTGEFFVTEWGIFILSPRSSFQPTKGTDPSYRPLADRIYWYEIKG